MHLDHARHEALTALQALRDGIVFDATSSNAPIVSWLRAEIAGMIGRLEALGSAIELVEGATSLPHTTPLDAKQLRRLRHVLADSDKAVYRAAMDDLRHNPGDVTVEGRVLSILTNDEREAVIDGEVV